MVQASVAEAKARQHIARTVAAERRAAVAADAARENVASSASYAASVVPRPARGRGRGRSVVSAREENFDGAGGRSPLDMQ